MSINSANTPSDQRRLESLGLRKEDAERLKRAGYGVAGDFREATLTKLLTTYGLGPIGIMRLLDVLGRLGICLQEDPEANKRVRWDKCHKRWTRARPLGKVRIQCPKCGHHERLRDLERFLATLETDG